MSEATTRERSQEHGLCAEERKSATGNRISSKGPAGYETKRQEACPMAEASQANCLCSNTPREFNMRPQEPKHFRLKNWVDGTQVVDTLHQKATNPLHCTNGRCTGSVVFPYGGEIPKQRPYGIPRHQDEVKIHAQDFLEQFYSSINLCSSEEHQQRLAEVIKTIEETGTYDMTQKELIFAAKTAWRNTPRCIGRYQWSSLQLIDARHITTTQEMFQYLLRHLEYGTNGGNIRPLITVFPHRKERNKDFQIWNTIMLSWAGYRQADGTVVGDPASVDFTEFCQSLGWKGKGSRFDILPLVLQANGGAPELFEIPENIVLQVKIKHPKFPWFEELGLKWFTVPVQTALMLDAGGLEFTAAPSSAWYLLTEVGTRDLGDPHRYNMLEVVAEKMGLDTTRNTSLWKDYALVELNYAVLHSFQEAGVTIADHHSATDSFMKHLGKEMKLRGGCPADWVWIVPPMSGSATPVFHQEMLNYTLKPNFEYQPCLWEGYGSTREQRKKLPFKTVANAVRFTTFLMRNVLRKRQKATILFATETGRSEDFARNLGKIMSHSFDVKVVCMKEYEHAQLTHESLLLVVTSTYGNGEPPENGTSFSSYLQSMKTSVDTRPLKNLGYSVFGLGSRLYLNFCAFGHFVDERLRQLGAHTILTMGEGDELSGQDVSFKEWARDVFQAACATFGVNDETARQVVSDTLKNMATGWFPGLYRWVKDRRKNLWDLCSNLSNIYNKTVCPVTVISVTELQSRESSRSTVLVTLDTGDNKELTFEPGDHVAIFPANKNSLVEELIDMMHDKPDPNWPIRLEVAQANSANPGGSKVWEPFNRLSLGCTLREALTRYLDITSVPTPQMLSYLAKLATSPVEKNELERLSKGDSQYEDWALNKECNILETLREFPSVQATADLLLTQLPALQPRFFSISSSPDVRTNEIHITAVVIEYRKRGGQGPLHHGVCSKWLKGLKRGDIVPCYIRHAPSFHLPVDSSVPVILIGNGTGIAPFRAFWQQRMFDTNNKCPPESSITGQRQWGDMRLIFGCRNSRLDDIYRHETDEAVKSKVLTTVTTAYSREEGKPKQYVQDLLKKDSSDIVDLILNGKAHVYVCGSAAMAEGVNSTFQALISNHLNLSPEEASDFVHELKTSNRYHEDVFEVAQRKKEIKGDKEKQATV